MGAQTVDYRVSRVVVCCKDCGQDVGLYPARHKCQDVIRPPLPPLPVMLNSNDGGLQVPRRSSPTASEGQRSRPNSSSSSVSIGQSEPSVGSKWSRFGKTQKDTPKEDEDEDESIYFSKFAAHLPEIDSQTSPAAKKLWNKGRQNDKWNQINEKHDKTKQGTKLWDKLIQATQSMAEKIPSRDDHSPESDESDFEGETHVARVLREYYEKRNKPLPVWMYDRHTRLPLGELESDHMGNRGNDKEVGKTTNRKQRLWETDDHQPSYREREREELRRATPSQEQVLRCSPGLVSDNQYRSPYGDEWDHTTRREESDHRRPNNEDRYPHHDNSLHLRSNVGHMNSPYENASRTAYNESLYTQYDKSSRSRYEQPSRSRYETFEESTRPRYNETQGPRNQNDYGRRQGQTTSYDHDYLAQCNSVPQDRLRGPREIPTRQSERAGGYF